MIEKVALLTLKQTAFALPVSGIEHILDTPKCFILPLLPRGYTGVLLYRGEVAPVVDLHGFFAQPAGSQGADPRLIVIYGCESGFVGLPVDGVLRIVDCGKGSEESVDQEEEQRFRRYFIYDGMRYPLLDIDALVESLPR